MLQLDSMILRLLKEGLTLWLILAIPGLFLANLPLPVRAAGTFTVNRADDIAPRAPGSTCVTANSTDCTLREAIIKANSDPGATIVFSSSLDGTPITLTLSGSDDTADLGDLDVTAEITIQGNGTDKTIIPAGAASDAAGNTNTAAAQFIRTFIRKIMLYIPFL
jgi:hypothetical protein